MAAKAAANPSGMSPYMGPGSRHVRNAPAMAASPAAPRSGASARVSVSASTIATPIRPAFSETMHTASVAARVNTGCSVRVGALTSTRESTMSSTA